MRQAGCIQFDPVDVCGKNAELTLQSRVKGFTKKMLGELLYEDRKLVDYADKELSIWPAEDWPYFSSYRDRSRELGDTFEGLEELKEQAIMYIKENDPVVVKFYKGSAFSVECENFVVLRVVQSDPSVKGNTATNATKEAVLETGAKIQVPMFVNEGELIRVDTRTGEYMERVKG